MAEGISTRHSRSCAKQRGGQRCTCQPTYTPWVFHPGKGGKVYGKATKQKAEAKGWRVDALASLNKKALAVPSKQTINEAAESLLEGMKSGQVRERSGEAYKPSTVRSYEQAYENYVRDQLGAMRLTDLSRNAVQNLADQLLGDGLSPSTVRNAVMPLRVICGRAIQHSALTINPTEGLRLPKGGKKRDRIAPPDEAERLLGVLPSFELAVFATAFFSGLRLGEIQALSGESVDLAAGTIKVYGNYDRAERRDVETKNRQRRIVDMPPILRDYLAEYVAEFGSEPKGRLFPSKRGLEGRPFGYTSVMELADRRWNALSRGSPT